MVVVGGGYCFNVGVSVNLDINAYLLLPASLNRALLVFVVSRKEAELNSSKAATSARLERWVPSSVNPLKR